MRHDPVSYGVTQRDAEQARIDNGCFWGLAFPGMGNLVVWELIVQPCLPYDAGLQVE